VVSGGGFAGQEAWALLNLQSMFSNQNLMGAESSFCITHIIHFMESLLARPNFATVFIIMA